MHCHHLTLAASHHVDHLRSELFGHVNHEFFDRFVTNAINLMINHLRLSHLQFVTFATHRFYKHRKVQHTTTRNNPAVGVSALFHTKCQVLLEFFLQTFVDVTRCTELTFLTKERRIVNGKKHRHRRFVNGNSGKRFWIFKVRDGVANLKLFQTNHGANVTTRHSSSLLASHTLKGLEFLDFGLFHRSIAVRNGDVHTLGDGATMHTTDSDTPCVVRIVERSDEQLRSTF